MGLEVRIRNASLSYDNESVFNNIHLHLQASQWTCILGQSGVGKSSLLRMVAGLLKSAAEQVQANVEINTGDGQALTGRMAWMAQQDLLLPWLRVLDNVLLGARLRQAVTIAQQLRQQAMAMLGRVGMAGLEDRYPASLSGGQRQRVALARTLMEDKPVVLMDEPFSALDAITRYRLQALAADVLQGKTILLITHDPSEAIRLGHQIQVLSRHQLGEPMHPPGKPVRALNDSALLPLQSQLLEQLVEARR